MKFINDKKAGIIVRDFSIEKSFESFCTDESMHSWFTDKDETNKPNKPAKPEVVKEEPL